MAVINVIKGMTIVNGTADNDEINLKSPVGDGIVINGNAGNDTITVTRGNDHIIKAGAGADFVTVAGGSNYIIDLGEGNDRIDLMGAEGHQVSSVSGTNNININAGSGYLIKGGTGIDRLTIKGNNSNNTAYLGAGADVLGMALGSRNEIHGGAGEDYFIISGGEKGVFYGDEDNDTIRLYRGEEHVVYAGDGNDSMLVTEANNNHVEGGAGQNQVMFFGGVGNSYVGGKDKDNITLKHVAQGVKVTGGTGATVVNIQAGDNHVIDLSKSSNTVTQIMAGSGTELIGGAGKDTFRAWGTTSNMKVDLGIGNDQVYVLDGSNLDIKGGEGYDVFTISGGKDIVVAGDKGKDTYNVAWCKLVNLTIDNRTAVKGDRDSLNITGAASTDFNYELDEDTLVMTDINSGEKLTILGWDISRMNSFSFKDGVFIGEDIVVMSQELKINAPGSYEVGKYKKVIVTGGVNNVILAGATQPVAIELTGLQGQNYGIGYEIDDQGKPVVKLYDLSQVDKPVVGTIKLEEVDAPSFIVPGTAGLATVALEDLKPNGIWDINNGKYLDGSVDLEGTNGTADNPYVYNAGEGNNDIKGKDNEHVEINGGSGVDKVDLNNPKDSTVNGGAGNDEISLGGGSNVNVAGGTGDDQIELNGGSEHTVTGGEGDDYISATGTKNSEINGGAGNDTLELNGGSGNTINATEGENTITVTGGESNTINGGKDNDTISVTGAKNSVVNGGEGDDNIEISGGNNVTVDGGAGADTITMENGSGNTISGGAGEDTITLNGGNGNTINGTEGENTITVTGGAANTINGGKDNDTISVNGAKDTEINGGAGNDTINLNGGSGNTVNGISGENTINVSGGENNTINGGKDKDTIIVKDAVDTEINGGAGDDIVTINSGKNITVTAGNGTDTINVNGGEGVTLSGGIGDDSINISGGKNVTADGGAGADTITVTGGENVTIIGGSGNDTYVVDWDKASGVTIDNRTAAADDTDKLSIIGKNATDFNYAINNGALILKDAVTGETMSILGWNTSVIKELTFQDGTISDEQIEAYTKLLRIKANGKYDISSYEKVIVQSGLENVVLNGAATAPVIEYAGLSGTNYGLSYEKDAEGNATIKIHDLSVEGNPAVETINVNGIAAATGTVVLPGVDGSISTSLSTFAPGNGIWDVNNGKYVDGVADISGTSGTPDNPFIYNAGDGNNEINAKDNEHIEINGGNATDKIDMDNVNDGTVNAGEGDDTVNVTGGSDNTINGGTGNDTINLNGGSGNTINGTEGENTITVTGGENNTVNGGTGVDTITATGAKYTEINGGDGADNITVENGTGNTVTGGAGNDTINLNGGSGNTINGTEGENTITVTGGENNTVNGGIGVDTITATNAKDTEINGGAGNDTINLNGGSGNTINGTEGENTITVTGGEDNTVNGGTGNDTISATDSTNTEINGGAGADNITVENGTGNTVTGGAGNDIINLNGGSGNTINGTEGENAITVTGGENNTVNGGTGVDTITANGAKDTKINGGVGNDIINVSGGSNVTVDGGEGTDNITVENGTGNTVVGGAGNDTINLNGGSGNTINGTEGENTIAVTSGENNTVNGGTGVDTITATGAKDTEINGGAGADNITVENGTGNTITGGAGDDIINLNGGSGNTINGTEGENTITVTGGENNTVNGGTGADTITATNTEDTEINGGAGNDTINLNGGSGNTINGTKGENTITVTGGENNTVNGGTGVDTITATNAKDTEINGGAGNDIINVSDGSNVTIDGGEGTDNITVENGTGNTVTGGAGNDTINLNGGSGNTINATEGMDTITVTGATNNIINTGADGSNITINGSSTGAMGTTINGGAGIDDIALNGVIEATVNAGAGNDIITIDSGEGNNIFAGDGNDTIDIKPGGDEIIHGGAGNDTINVNWSKGGNFTIDNTDAAAGDIDTLSLNVGQGEVNFAYDEATDTLTITKQADPHDTITIKGAAEYGFNEIKFTDGTTSTEEIIDILNRAGKELLISASGNYIIDDKTEKIVFSGRNWNATISGSNTLEKTFDFSAYEGGLFVYEYASKVEAGTVTLKLFNIAGGAKSLYGTVTFELANMTNTNKVLINNSLQDFEAPSDSDILYYSSANDTEIINGAELSQGKPVAIIGNGGNDSFTLNDIKQAEIGLGAGDDTLQINGIEGSSIDTGTGTDSLTIDWAKKVELQVNAKNGMDVIQLQNINSDQLTYSYITNSNYVQLTLTDGSNSLTINNIKRDEAQKVVFDDKSVVYATMSTFPNGNTKQIKGYSVEADQYVVLVPEIYVYGVNSKYNPYGVMSNIGGYTVTKAQAQKTVFDFSEFGVDNELQLQYYDNNVYLEMSPYINNGTYYNYYPIRLTNMGTGKFTYRAYSNAGATYALYERHYDTSSAKYVIDSMSFDESNNEINWTTTVGTKQLLTNGGADVINIKAGTEIDMLDSGSGDDTINITSGLVREIFAGEGNDTINIESSVTKVDAGVGNDTITVDLKKSGSFTIDNTTAGAEDIDKLIIKNSNEADLQYAYNEADDILTITDKSNQYGAPNVLTILGVKEHGFAEITYADGTISGEALIEKLQKPTVIDGTAPHDDFITYKLSNDKLLTTRDNVLKEFYDFSDLGEAGAVSNKFQYQETQTYITNDYSDVRETNSHSLYFKPDGGEGVIVQDYFQVGAYQWPAINYKAYDPDSDSYVTFSRIFGGTYRTNVTEREKVDVSNYRITATTTHDFTVKEYISQTYDDNANVINWRINATLGEMNALAGDDTINVNIGTITNLYAGDGNDTININGGAVANLYAGDGNDTINVNGTAGIIYGGKGNDTIIVDLDKSSSVMIDNTTAAAGDLDALEIKDYNKLDFSYEYDNVNDVLKLIRGEKSISIKGFSAHGFQNIKFADANISSVAIMEEMTALTGKLRIDKSGEYTILDSTEEIIFSGKGLKVKLVGGNNINKIMNFVNYTDGNYSWEYTTDPRTGNMFINIVNAADDGFKTVVGTIEMSAVDNPALKAQFISSVGGTYSSSFTYDSKQDVYYGSRGNDDVVLAGKEDKPFSVNGYVGDDNITITGGNVIEVLGMHGNDTIKVEGGNKITLAGGYGDDAYIVDWEKAKNVTIKTGVTGTNDPGKDTLQILNANYEDFTSKFNYTASASPSSSLVLTDRNKNTITIEGIHQEYLTRIQFADKTVEYVPLVGKTTSYSFPTDGSVDVAEYLAFDTKTAGFIHSDKVLYNLTASTIDISLSKNSTNGDDRMSFKTLSQQYIYNKGNTKNEVFYYSYGAAKYGVYYSKSKYKYLYDSITYNPYADNFSCTKEANKVYAGSGDDIIRVSAAIGKLYVGAGNDTVTPDFTKISALDIDFTGAEVGDVNTIKLDSYMAEACSYVYNVVENSLLVNLDTKNLLLSNLNNLEHNLLVFKNNTYSLQEILSSTEQLDVTINIEHTSGANIRPIYNGNDSGERIIISNRDKFMATVNCGAGNDFVESKHIDPKARDPRAMFTHEINLGAGDDIFLGNCINDGGLVSGGDGNDIFVVNDWDNTIDAGNGDDVIYVGGSVQKEVSYVVYNYTADNYLTGGAGNDTFIVAWGDAPGSELIDEDEATVKLVGVNFQDMKAVLNTSKDTVRISTAADNYIDLKTWSAGGYKQISFLDETAGKCYSFDANALSQISTAEVSFGSLTCNTTDLSEIDQEQLKTLKLAGTNLY